MAGDSQQNEPAQLLTRCATLGRLPARWLHNLRVGDYGGAALNISSLVATQQHSVAGAQRLLAMDKLAAWAASPVWPAAVEGQLAAVAEDASAQLGMLALQVGVLVGWVDGVRPCAACMCSFFFFYSGSA